MSQEMNLWKATLEFNTVYWTTILDLDIWFAENQTWYERSDSNLNKRNIPDSWNLKVTISIGMGVG